MAGASGAAQFFSSFLVYSFAMFVTPLTTEFTWSREVVASAFAIMSITVAAVAPLFGYVFDRFGVRRVIVPCMAALGLGFIALSRLSAQWELTAIYIFFGVVGSGLVPTGYARVVSGWFDTRRGLAIAIIVSGTALAAMVQPLLTQALIDTVGWRLTYVVIGLAILTIACPVVVGFVRERSGGSASRAMVAAGGSLGKGLRSRIFWTLCVVIFASALVTTGITIHLAALLTDRGVPSSSAALIVSTMGASSLAGRLTTGWLVDRFFAPRVSLVMLLLTALGTYLLTDADTPASGAVAAMLIGFGMGGEYDVTPYMVSRYFDLRAFATLYSIAFSAAAAAGAIGPVLLARTFDDTGSYESLLPKLALFVVSVSVLMLTLPSYGLHISAQGVAARLPGSPGSSPR